MFKINENPPCHLGHLCSPSYSLPPIPWEEPTTEHCYAVSITNSEKPKVYLEANVYKTQFLIFHHSYVVNETQNPG